MHDFVINKIFKKLKHKNLKYKTRDLPSTPNDKYWLPALTAGILNQGLNNFVPGDGATIFKNVISVSANGANTGAMFYQTQNFTVLQDSYVIDLIDKPVHIDAAYLYLVGALQKSIRFNYDWTNKAGWERIKNKIVTLPINEDGSLAFEYMERYIKEIELENIRKIDNFIKESNLDNYILNDEEKKLIHDFRMGGVTLHQFKINDLFTVLTPKKKFNANQVSISNHGYPYIVRTSENNGIKGYINENENYLNSGETISFGQDTATAFYQKNPYFTADKIKIFKPIFKNENEFLLLFITTAIRKSFSQFSWGSSSFNVSILNNQSIQLPVSDNNKPDYEKMTKYIKSIEKLIITNIIEWKNHKKKMLTKI